MGNNEEHDGMAVVSKFPVSRLRSHPDLQLRPKGTDASTVSRYTRLMERGDGFLPIIVASIGRNRYVVDGYHRWEAAEKAGLAFISADVRKMSLDEARRQALFANAGHGRGLTSADKQAVWAEYLAQGRHLDDDGLGGKRLRLKADIARDFASIYARGYVYKLLRKADLIADEYDGPSYWDSGKNEGDLEPQETEAEAMLSIRAALDGIVATYSELDNTLTRWKAEDMIRETLEAIVPAIPPAEPLDI